VNILLKRSAEMFVPLYRSFGGLIGPKYKDENFRSVVSEYLGDDVTSNTTIPTMVVAYDLEQQDFKAITSWDKEEVFKKVDSINSTAAAASYFQPCRINPVNNSKKTYTLTDGGIGANNPTFFLLTKAMELYPNAEHFEVLSIGSGYAHRPLSYQEMKDAGLIQWAPHLPRLFITSQTIKDHMLLSRMFLSEPNLQNIKKPFLKGKYSRWSPLLNKENTKIDNTDDINLMEIVSSTDDYIDSEQQCFNELVERLRSPKDVF
jgi:patatin-like phospholipase/acyl hydrolase